MKCCLWLNGVKVWNTRDIKNNFDPASLRGYYLGGSLLRWLRANGGEEEAEKLEETGNIEYSFGMTDNVQLIIDNEDDEQLCGNPGESVSFSCGRETCQAFCPQAAYSGGAVGGSGSLNLFGSGSASGSSGYGLHII
ncbi:MAG: hypothetical protein LBC86_05550 [Oscillospiraceae bacterium]|nr:hypothetical protein [Oscillospiraceae bacterium]